MLRELRVVQPAASILQAGKMIIKITMIHLRLQLLSSSERSSGSCQKGKRENLRFNRVRAKLFSEEMQYVPEHYSLDNHPHEMEERKKKRITYRLFLFPSFLPQIRGEQ